MLFETINIAGIKIPNRFVRSATHEWMAEPDGTPTSRIGDLYGELARNEVGLIITGYAYVDPKGKSDDLQQGIYDDSFIGPYKEIVARVHEHGSKIVLQIAHGGRQTMITADNPYMLAPSAVIETTKGMTPEEMTGKEVLETIENFAQAARRAKEAGFDGVQLHCAHGFLLSNFLSPYTNRRNDRWGGSTKKRTQVILDIISRVRELAGENYPILVKLNVTDGFKPGAHKHTLDAPESIEIAKILADNGVCAIEVSGGVAEAGEELFRTMIDSPKKEAYYREYAKMIKEQVDVPVILVGGIRSKQVMEMLLKEGYADMISLCRPLIAEPDLVMKLKKGETESAKCVSCNLCSDETGIKCNYNFTE
ncbi:MAG: salicylyl-CoA 5-hydroxylase [Methanomethylovorans sp. PtaU1.Bin093]|uniref:NADH:flavin oxidoreductase n=1 Tax=Methanomethylovorans sp. PtaU1.Bin093 TaxID=1811679 RepID=UPI0009C55B51|nr:NADH:flavin oxidoreductase [Methanomethylovorans sp. PtaU1.Bin093]OPY21670.1 MAG: salicylyl-CoA 5-hydroxylase [Methanomethylovorans sp. PtaU1.Bin093]